MGSVFGTFKGASPKLEEVKAMSGPTVEDMGKTAAKLAQRGRTLAKVEPPEELVGGHALVLSAWALADTALRLRIRSVADNDVELARQASSAAAGALMLYVRGQADLTKAMEKPGPK